MKVQILWFVTAAECSAQPTSIAFEQLGSISQSSDGAALKLENDRIEGQIGSIRREACLRTKKMEESRRPQKFGPIATISLLGGLYHQYVTV
jgi:hypothetical protein